MFTPPLQIGETITNNQLHDIFGCSTQGGMRPSKSTNTLVLVSKSTRDALYKDKWLGNILHYTGEGQIGDQKLSRANKILADSPTTTIGLFLFEKLDVNQYRYRGRCILAEQPYPEIQKDQNGDERTVLMFPLRLIDDIADLSELEKAFKERVIEASLLSNEELRKRAMNSQPGPVGKRKVFSTYFQRNADVAEHAKRRANGVCQLCENAAPFNDSRGKPFLETHHIQWLANEGSDTIDNTVALCPNCHRKMHIVNDASDVQRLQEVACEK
jgi:5-methylcytosine-specific restriction enzyme A